MRGKAPLLQENISIKPEPHSWTDSSQRTIRVSISFSRMPFLIITTAQALLEASFLRRSGRHVTTTTTTSSEISANSLGAARQRLACKLAAAAQLSSAVQMSFIVGYVRCILDTDTSTHTTDARPNCSRTLPTKASHVFALIHQGCTDNHRKY
ncbi:uncharacterized protein UDID_17844 [Ustilago sp. UG-2017a]|nr:uncharacterized protein UDID_17844 [Ustilago sp. UG-2017a]